MMASKEIAEKTGASVRLVNQWAAANEVQYMGEGRRKVYIWKEADFERFKARNTTVGRPKKEKKF